jgi:hypothetical protein
MLADAKLIAIAKNIEDLGPDPINAPQRSSAPSRT